MAELQQILAEIPLIVCRFDELSAAMFPLHGGDVDKIASLHDVWKLGAPSPESIVIDPRKFDERIDQRKIGNVVRRNVFPFQLAQWIVDMSKLRGHEYSLRQALDALRGKVSLV